MASAADAMTACAATSKPRTGQDEEATGEGGPGGEVTTSVPRFTARDSNRCGCGTCGKQVCDLPPILQAAFHGIQLQEAPARAA